jgi:hypothetical protein
MSDVIKFRTNDLVLATLLHMEGYKAEHVFDRRKNCVWVFDVPQDPEECDAFHDLVDDFADNLCAVEPRRFARTWAEVRREMYVFLGHDGRR